jgi:hypothetical protein
MRPRHECAYTAMTYDGSGASCAPARGGCGMRWQRDEYGYGLVTLQGRVVARRFGGER